VRAVDTYHGPWNRRTANPILVIGNTADPSTPYANSVEMARELRSARLLTVTGYGHTTFLNPSACANRYIAAYLERRTLPPAHTVCRQDRLPFANGREPANRFRVLGVRTQVDGTLKLHLGLPGPGTVDVLETARDHNLARAARGDCRPCPRRNQGAVQWSAFSPASAFSNVFGRQLGCIEEQAKTQSRSYEPATSTLSC
jgi:hypothetical protein